MRTYSHFLLTALLRRATGRGGGALLAGSVAPDAPLALLSAGYLVDRRYLRPHLPDKTRCSPTYNDLYFHNRWWIAAHNTLHAPLPLLALGLVGALGRRKGLLGFVAGCALHGAVDALTHADDGPVLLFPLDWQWRFRSPVSYWDPEHGGRLFRLLEHAVDAAVALALLRSWRRRART